MNKQENEELKALIEHEERNLLFYTLYYDSFIKQGLATEEIARRIDYHLDRLIQLYEQIKNSKR